jgi:hypothetical protein
MQAFLSGFGGMGMERKLKEDAQALAVDTLKATQLHVEAWMTPRDKADWMSFFGNASVAGCLKCLGVQEALRFRAASAGCRQVLEVDDEWRALTFLARHRDGLQACHVHGAAVPSAVDLAAAHDKVMQVCLQNQTFQIRLHLEGIDDEIIEE